LSQNNPISSHEFRQQDAPRRQEKHASTDNPAFFIRSAKINL